MFAIYEEHILNNWRSKFSFASLDLCKTGQTFQISCCCWVTKSCLTLCDPMHCSATGHPVPHYPPEFAQGHVPWVSDAIQPSHPLTPSSPLAFSLCQHQGLFWWIGPSHQMYHIRYPVPPKKVISHAFAWPHSMVTGRKEVFVGNPVLPGCMDPQERFKFTPAFVNKAL